jgi:hypothetical protein
MLNYVNGNIMRILVWILLLFFSSGCSSTIVVEDITPEEVFPCAEVRDWLYDFTLTEGKIRRAEIWLPERPDATAEDIRNGTVQMKLELFWFITVNDKPALLLLPCNLPESYKQDRLEITFSGHVLRPELNTSGLSSAEPFSLSLIKKLDDDEN